MNSTYDRLTDYGYQTVNEVHSTFTCREHCARKDSLENNLLDLYRRGHEASDPVVSKESENDRWLHTKKLDLPEETKNMLLTSNEQINNNGTDTQNETDDADDEEWDIEIIEDVNEVEQTFL